MKRWLRPTAVSLVLGFALAEGAARFWLENLTSDDTFRRFASIDMLRERTRREGLVAERE